MNIDNSYRMWLEKEKKLSSKVAMDYVSRTNRLLGLVEICEADALVDVKYKLDKSNIFFSLSPSVKSQIRRALTLYLEWRDWKKQSLNNGIID